LYHFVLTNLYSDNLFTNKYDTFYPNKPSNSPNYNQSPAKISKISKILLKICVIEKNVVTLQSQSEKTYKRICHEH